MLSHPTGRPVCQSPLAGARLPRSNGWGATEVAVLQVQGRPDAFVQLLRAMLQPDPRLRPSAQQVVEAVAREQPAVAGAAQEAVDLAAAAAQAEEAAAALAARQQQLRQWQGREAETGPSAQDFSLQSSPFMLAACHRRDSSNVSMATAPEEDSPQAAATAAAATAADQFSFDVPLARCHSNGSVDFAFTPGQPQPLRPHNSRRPGGGGAGGPPGTAMKVRGTPAGRGSRAGHARWAPALSPLISEGALTPGAAAALAGLTPAPRCGSSSSEGVPTPQLLAPGSGSSTPLDLRRPAPLQLPPQTAAMAILSSGSASMLTGSGGHGSGGTQDSRDGWRLSRRDILSPDSDVYNCEGRAEQQGGCQPCWL